MSERAVTHFETEPVTLRELGFATDEQRQEWNTALITVQLANPWTDWEIEPDPGALLLDRVREDAGLLPAKEDYDEVYWLAHEIATYQGADEVQEDEGDE